MASTARGQRTRQLIIDATSVVFAQQGFAAASLSQLVEATGLTRGAFYFHFESKDALAEAIARQHAELWPRLMAQVKTEESKPLRRLLLFFYRSGTEFSGDVVVLAGSRLLTERSLIKRELPSTYIWWVGEMRALLREAHDDHDLADLGHLITPDYPATHPDADRDCPELNAVAEHIVSCFFGLQQAMVLSKQNDLTDRSLLFWRTTLPWLCRMRSTCDELVQFVDELAATMRRATADSAGAR